MKQIWYDNLDNAMQLVKWMNSDTPVKVSFKNDTSEIVEIIEITGEFFIGVCDGKKEFIFHSDVNNIEVA